MAYQATVKLNDLDNKDTYKNGKGEHQCVALVQKVTSVPDTTTWKRGKRVLDAKPGEMNSGTVIATFDEQGKYPLTERHAVIYISHNSEGIDVYDQWVAQGKVKRRTIRRKDLAHRNVNDAKYYYVVD